MRIVALDLAVRKTVLAERIDGEVELKTFGSLKKVIAHLGPQTPRAKVVFESCRQAWYLAKRLRSAGHEPIIVDTTRIKELGIGRHGRKTDEIDVVLMLIAGEQDRIPQAHQLSEASQQIRLQQNVRDLLVKTRAELVGSARQIAHAHGEAIQTGATASFTAQVTKSNLSKTTQSYIEPLRRSIEVLTGQIVEVEKKLEQLADKEPAVKLLCTCPGVGPVVAMAFISVIDDPQRFKTAHQLESYVGLVPSERSSGTRRRLGSISKAGNGYLRSMLVQSAQSILRLRDPDPLKTWGEGIEHKRGRKIASIAIARRLAGILWAMWRDNQPYHSATLAARSHRGLKRLAIAAKERTELMKKAETKLRANRRAWERVQQGLAAN